MRPSKRPHERIDAHDRLIAPRGNLNGVVIVQLELGLGSASAVVWTCDFSYDYVKINAEYHT